MTDLRKTMQQALDDLRIIWDDSRPSVRALQAALAEQPAPVLTEELQLIAAVLRGYPDSMARADALRAVGVVQAEVEALRSFHSFFIDRGEALFAAFGMPAVDLFNAVARPGGQT